MEQANLSLRWAHMSEGTFSHVVAQIIIIIIIIIIINTCVFSSVHEVYYYYKVNQQYNNSSRQPLLYRNSIQRQNLLLSEPSLQR